MKSPKHEPEHESERAPGGARQNADANAEEANERRLIVGLQPVREAISVHASQLFRVGIEAKDTPRLAALERFARDQGVPEIVRISTSKLDSLARGASHQGVAALAPPLALADAATLWQRTNLVAVALDKIQDPQNFGAIVRSSVGLANASIVWGEHSSAPLSTAMFRASAGAVEHAELCRVPSLAGALRDAAMHGVSVVGLDAHAKQTLADVDLQRPCVLVMGAEHTGLSHGVKKACTELASLTPLHHIDSLNVSVATGIALYEAARQRSNA